LAAALEAIDNEGGCLEHLQNEIEVRYFESARLSRAKRQIVGCDVKTPAQVKDVSTALAGLDEAEFRRR
jgi:hypothetical protein